MDWTPFDFALAAALLGGAGLLLALSLRNPRSLVFPAVAACVGVAAIVLGEADDAPGLVLFGLILIAATVTLTVKRRQAA